MLIPTLFTVPILCAAPILLQNMPILSATSIKICQMKGNSANVHCEMDKQSKLHSHKILVGVCLRHCRHKYIHNETVQPHIIPNSKINQISFSETKYCLILSLFIITYILLRMNNLKSYIHIKILSKATEYVAASNIFFFFHEYFVCDICRIK